jgi:hypothetical protein
MENICCPENIYVILKSWSVVKKCGIVDAYVISEDSYK